MIPLGKREVVDHRGVDVLGLDRASARLGARDDPRGLGRRGEGMKRRAGPLRRNSCAG